MEITTQIVRTADLDINVAIAGTGPPLVLLHGFPHTWRVWSAVMPSLAQDHTVIAPDLRGLGATARADDGYDAATLADDIGALLDALGVVRADLVAIDAGVPGAFTFAVGHPERVRRLVLMEAILGGLPGAESMLAAGPPWWFGFHAVPGLAERVLLGHEAEYLDFFYRSGTHAGRGIDEAIRDEFVQAYTGSESLRCAFEHYRAMPQSAAQIRDIARTSRLVVPTLAIGAQPVGDALHRQLEPIADDLSYRLIEDCGHIIPLDQPVALLHELVSFLR